MKKPAIGRINRLRSNLSTDTAPIAELTPPSRKAILVSGSGSLLAFSIVGVTATIVANKFAIILSRGELNATHRATPVNEVTIENISIFVRPPTPFLTDARNIAPAANTLAPYSHNELSAPLARWFANVQLHSAGILRPMSRGGVLWLL